jgi:hypothetical protein
MYGVLVLTELSSQLEKNMLKIRFLNKVKIGMVLVTLKLLKYSNSIAL